MTKTTPSIAHFRGAWWVVAAVLAAGGGCKPTPPGGLTVQQPSAVQNDPGASGGGTYGTPGDPSGGTPAPSQGTMLSMKHPIPKGAKIDPRQFANSIEKAADAAAANANVPTVKGDPSLSGEWKEIVGGYRLKFPPGFKFDSNEVIKTEGTKVQRLGGQTDGGVRIYVDCEHRPGANHQDLAGLMLAVQQGKVQSSKPVPTDQMVVRLNDLLCIKKRYQQQRASPFRNHPAELLSITEYSCWKGDDRLTARIHSTGDFDDPSYVTALEYLHTLQRSKMPTAGQ